MAIPCDFKHHIVHWLPHSTIHSKKQALHDIMAKTIVIEAEDSASSSEVISMVAAFFFAVFIMIVATVIAVKILH
jgi:hypothetical protein